MIATVNREKAPKSKQQAALQTFFDLPSRPGTGFAIH
jgi:hypothetical protein